MKAKLISVLGIFAAIAMTVAPQLTTLNPKIAQWALLAGTLITAVSGSLLAHLADRLWPTLIGAGVAVFGVIAGAAGLLPSKWTYGAGIAGTVLAALGRSLFGWNESTSVDPAITPRSPRE